MDHTGRLGHTIEAKLSNKALRLIKAHDRQVKSDTPKSEGDRRSQRSPG